MESAMVLTRRQFGVTMLSVATGVAPRAGAIQAAVWDTGKIAVPGGNIFWRAYGKGTSLPLLMVHGGPSGASSKPYEMMSGLGDERRLLTWDQLDCGESDHPNDPANWRYARFAAEMDAVRNKLTPGPVHVLGASWGSTVMMEWLVTKRPANVASIIFMCPTLDAARVDASMRNAQARLSPTSKQAFDDLARTGDLTDPALTQANAEYQRTFIVHRPPPGFASGSPNPAMLHALDVDRRGWSRVADLAKLTPPVLFVRGEYDFVTAEDVAAYAAARPNSEVATIPDAAHVVFADNPEATIEVVRRFLAKAERQRQRTNEMPSRRL
jgi:pimeloyl-ACP methyl ester carboxylesterase